MRTPQKPLQPFTRVQTLREEFANSLIHAFGVLFAIGALITLVNNATNKGSTWEIVSFSIFGISLILLYSTSTLYHGMTNPRLKNFFHVLDHASIYLLIAGSYTPIVLGPMRGPLGWTMFAIIWALALTGILFKLVLKDRIKIISVGIYVGMGWLSMTQVKPMLEMIPEGFFIWLLLGGLSYTFGVVFYMWKRLPYHHAIWHVFVLGGSFFHFWGIFKYLS